MKELSARTSVYACAVLVGDALSEYNERRTDSGPVFRTSARTVSQSPGCTSRCYHQRHGLSVCLIL